jgi:hypothetical protein
MRGIDRAPFRVEALHGSGDKRSALLVHYLQHQVLTTAAVPSMLTIAVSPLHVRGRRLMKKASRIAKSIYTQLLVPMTCEHSNREAASNTVCSYKRRRRRRRRSTRRTKSSCCCGCYSRRFIILHPGGIMSNK